MGDLTTLDKILHEIRMEPEYDFDGLGPERTALWEAIGSAEPETVS